MSNYHEVELIGFLGRDPESRFTPNGKQVTDFSVAVGDGVGENKTTIWFNITTWEKLAESCNKYLAKSSQVFVKGRLQHENGNPKQFKRKDGSTGTSFEVTATIVRFLDRKGTGPTVAGQGAAAEPAYKYDKEDIPF